MRRSVSFGINAKGNVINKVEELSATVNKASDSFKKMAKNANTHLNFAASIYSINSIYRGLAAITKQAADFDNNITRSVSGNISNFAVNGTFELSTDTAAANILKVREGITQTASLSRASINTVAQSVSTLAARGIQAQAALDMFPTVNRVSNAFNADIETASKFVADLSRFSGVATTETDKFSKILNSVAFASKTAGFSLSQMQSLIQNNAAAFNELGVTIDDISKMSVSFRLAGVSGENIGRTIEQFTAGINKMRLNSGTLTIDKDTIDFRGDINSIVSQMSGLGDSARLAFTRAMFGAKGGDGATALNALLSQSVHQIEQINKGLNETQAQNFVGMLDSIISNTPAERINNVKSSLENTAIILGNQLLPAVELIANGLSLITEHLTSRVNPALFAGLGLLVKIIGVSKTLEITTAAIGIIKKAVLLTTSKIGVAIGLNNALLKSGVIIQGLSLKASLLQHLQTVKTAIFTKGFFGFLGVALKATKVGLLIISKLNPFGWIVLALAGLFAIIKAIGRIFGFFGKKTADPFDEIADTSKLDELLKAHNTETDAFDVNSGFSGLIAGNNENGLLAAAAPQIEGTPVASRNGGEKITRHEVRLFFPHNLSGIASDGSRAVDGVLTIPVSGRV